MRRLEKAVQEGQLPIVFDNHYISYARIKNLLYKIVGAHFVTIHSFTVNEETDTVEFTYWDYGSVKENPFLKLDLKPKSTGSLSGDMKALKKFRRKGLHKRKKQISIDEFLLAMKGYWIPEK